MTMKWYKINHKIRKNTTYTTVLIDIGLKAT